MLGLLEKFSRLEELISQSALKNVDSDQILLMNGISWDIYETLLRGFPNNSHYRFKFDDLVIYQGLGVAEVWFWQNNQFSLYYLRGDKYESISKSEFLPNLDLNVLASFVISDEKPREIILKFLQHIRRGNS